MRTLLIPLAVLAIALPSAAAQVAAGIDQPERILATELPTRGEVLDRLHHAVDAPIRRQAPSVDHAIMRRLAAADAFIRLGYPDQAVEFANAALAIHQANAVEIGSTFLSDIAEIQFLAGAEREAESLARDTIRNELEAYSRDGELDAQERIFILAQMAEAFDFLPVVRAELLREILFAPSLNAGYRERVELDLMGTLLLAGRLDEANRIYRRYLTRTLDAGGTVNWVQVAALAATTEGPDGRRIALDWYHHSSELDHEVLGLVQTAGLLIDLGELDGAVPFLNAALREGLAREIGHNGAVHLATGYAAVGRCDLALAIADWAELLSNASGVGDTIAARSNPSQFVDPISPWSLQAESQPEVQIMQARIVCGERDEGFEGFFNAMVFQREHLRSDALSAVYLSLEDRSGRDQFLAMAGVRMATGQIPEFDDQAGYTLAFEAMALDAGGYRQMADDRLLEAWNASTSDHIQIEGLVWIYHALDRR